MNSLESVIKDFYDCINIHARYVDSEFNLLYKTNSPLYVDNLINEVNLYDSIKINAASITKHTYYKSIHFIVMPIVYTHYNGYIIVGPFKSENICTDLDIPFKPLHCIDYIINTLKYIIRDKLNNKHGLSDYVENAIIYIHKNYYNDIKIDDLCSYLNINKSYFCRIFKKESGYTFSNFLNKFRVEKSKEFLTKNEDSILDVALSVGYNNHNYYSSMFKKFNNQTPMEFKNSFHNQIKS